MNLFNALSTHFKLLFNSKSNFEIASEIGYLKGKQLIFTSISEVNILNPLSVSTKVLKSSIWPQVGKILYDDYYLVFTIGITILVIAIELAIIKNARTVKKELLEQNSNLKQSLDMLEGNMEKNFRTLQVIAHDLRSPIAGIVGLTAFMIDEDKLSLEDMEVIRLINTTGNDSLKFISDLLDTNAPVCETTELVDLHLLITYCIAQLQPRASEKKQQIILESNREIVLKLNRENIWRVMHNLITNAIKFSPMKGEIAISVKQIGHKVIVAIKDQGIGIPFELQDQLFGDENCRKRKGTAGEKSFGMGLSIAKQIVENHHGNLSFKSNVDAGTTFFMELPVL